MRALENLADEDVAALGEEGVVEQSLTERGSVIKEDEASQRKVSCCGCPGLVQVPP